MYYLKTTIMSTGFVTSEPVSVVEGYAKDYFAQVCEAKGYDYDLTTLTAGGIGHDYRYELTYDDSLYAVIILKEGLIGESEVYFFTYEEKARRMFNRVVSEHEDVIDYDDIGDDDENIVYREDDVVTFYSGYCNELDSHMQNCTTHIIFKKLEHAIHDTHYILSYGEGDEYTLTTGSDLGTSAEMMNIHDQLIQLGADLDFFIDPSDETTWEDEKLGTVYSKELRLTPEFSFSHFEYYFYFGSESHYLRQGKITLH